MTDTNKEKAMRRNRPTSFRKPLAIAAALATTVVVGVPLAAWASSHREAPAISEDPAVDDTDAYAFVSPQDPNKVVIVGNWFPAEEPSGGPNYFRFSDAARYGINIDTDGQLPVDDITYEFAFQTEVVAPDATFLAATGPISSLDDAHYNLRQYFSVTKIASGTRGLTITRDVSGRRLLSPPNNIGPFSTPNYEQLAAAAVYELGDGVRVFAGQRDDAFFLDLGAVFDGLQLRPITGTLTGDNPARLGQPGGGQDSLAGFNVHTIAIEIPLSQLVMPQQPIIGIYTSASRAQMTVLNPDGTTSNQGDFVQVSRLGFPLANELFDSIPMLKDQYNRAEPGGEFDRTVLLPRVRNPEVTNLFKALFPAAFSTMNLPPQDRRDDLVAAILTGVPGVNRVSDNPPPADLLRLNTSLGAARKPGDPPCPQPTGMPCYSPLGVIGGDVTGFPNGRRPWDDIVDVELRVAAGVLYKPFVDPNGPDFNAAPNNLLADGVDVNDKPFLAGFPFLGTPSGGYDTPHAGPIQGNEEIPTATPVVSATPTAPPTGTATQPPTATPTATAPPTATTTRPAPTATRTNTVPPTPTVPAPASSDNGGCSIATNAHTSGTAALTFLTPAALLWWVRRRRSA